MHFSFSRFSMIFQAVGNPDNVTAGSEILILKRIENEYHTSENFSASIVALEMSSLKSGLNREMSLTKPNKMSV